MSRWYNESGKNSDIILVSRIRLLRNFAGWPFPGQESESEVRALLSMAEEKLSDLSTAVQEEVSETPAGLFEESERQALKERHIINNAALRTNHDYRLFTSESEDFSLTLNVEDHVRLLLSRRGDCLTELWEKISYIDDYIDSCIPYAFDKKQGFRTSRISNMGTGMRCYYVMHLPLLTEEPSFKDLLAEMTKHGVIVRDALDLDEKHTGGLYVLYNQRTLGLSENDIMDILSLVAGRLMDQEKELRKNADLIKLKDRVMRAYGLLTYARLMDLPESCRLISDIMLGESLGFFKNNGNFSSYELMLGVFPGNLQVYYQSLFNEDEIKEKRAGFLQHFLSRLEISDK